MLAATLCAVLGAAPVSRAQQGIPDQVISATQLSEADKAAIDGYVDANKAGLTDKDKVKHSRSALCEPLRRIGVSDPFRRYYSGKVIPVIDPVAASDNELFAINALRIAGMLGTKDGLDIALKGLEDKRPAVRVEAAMSVGLAISTAGLKGSPLVPAILADALTVFDVRLAAENEPRVLDAMVQALEDAMHLSGKDLPGVPAMAVDLLLKAVNRLATVPSPSPNLDPVFAHATKSLIDALTAPDGKPATPVIQEIAGVAGDIVAMIVRRIDAPGGLPAVQRSQVALIAGQCERIVQLAARAMDSHYRDYKLEELLLGGKDAEFKAAAGAMFTDLTGSTFGRDPKRYPKQP